MLARTGPLAAGQKLSKRLVDEARPRARDYVLWDGELPRFGLRVRSSGTKTYVVQYRARGVSRLVTLAPHGVLTLVQARRLALVRLAEVAHGQDPAERRDASRRAPTLRQLAVRYLTEHAVPKKKPKSAEGDERILRLHVLPRLGTRRVEDITRADVARLHHGMQSTPIQANRTVALLSKMFALAELWGLREGNPARGIEKYRETRKERFLNDREIERLGRALTAAEADGSASRHAVAALRLLMLTGCRKGEILGLHWGDADFDRGLLVLRDSKTGRRAVPLSAPALEILEQLQSAATGSDWVIEGEVPGQPLVNLWKPWRRIRKAAGLDDVRIHDLRHSHASVGAHVGLSLPLIGALLGHASPATTARYAHLADAPLRQASNLVGERIAAALAGEQLAEVIPFPRRRG